LFEEEIQFAPNQEVWESRAEAICAAIFFCQGFVS
jgi:hypothetical protein